MLTGEACSAAGHLSVNVTSQIQFDIFLKWPKFDHTLTWHF